MSLTTMLQLLHLCCCTTTTVNPNSLTTIIFNGFVQSGVLTTINFNDFITIQCPIHNKNSMYNSIDNSNSFKWFPYHVLEISNSCFRHSKAKLRGEPFNSGLIPVLTCVLSYFDVKLRVITVVLAWLSLVLNMNNLLVWSSNRCVSLRLW